MTKATEQAGRKWSRQLTRNVAVGFTLLVTLGALSLERIKAWLPHHRVQVVTPATLGIRVGAEVRMEGIAIGRVESMEMAARDAQRRLDPQRRIQVTLAIQKKYSPEVRSDSVAEIKVAGLLGEPFFSLSRGVTGAPAPPGGHVRFKNSVRIGDFLIEAIRERVEGQQEKATKRKDRE